MPSRQSIHASFDELRRGRKQGHWIRAGIRRRHFKILQRRAGPDDSGPARDPDRAATGVMPVIDD
jgi:hypothetical protein